MKKVVIATIFLILIIVLGVVELNFNTKNYDSMLSKLHDLEITVAKNQSNPSSDEVQNEIRNIKKDWENYKKFFLLTTNHTITKQIDQHLSSIETTSKEEAYPDLCLYINILKTLINEQKKELHPSLDNLF